ncbi:MAG: ferritin-like domain-containing protein [Actinomycetales bacterium]|nr:ferritin-like domain-containing protein [Actinomycetales bacterium]
MASLDDDQRRHGATEAGIVDLLGLLACGELLAFEQRAADAGLAPRLADRVALARHAARELVNFDLLTNALAERGVQVAEAMEPFLGPLSDFHRLTRPADWWEGLVKVYVGEGLVGDFYREIGAHLDDATLALIAEVSRTDDVEGYILARVSEAIAEEPQRAGRLALWGRRILGEALSQAQQVLAAREGLSGLVLEPDVPIAAALTRMSGVLYAIQGRHAHRMRALGLDP